jgi:hypothetical protein
LRLWIRHGLPNLLNMRDTFKTCITFTPPIEFDLEFISNSIVDIVADFQPSSSYELHIAANQEVSDSLGLSLQSSSLSFTMSSASRFLMGPDRGYHGIVFESSYATPELYTFFARNPLPIEQYAPISDIVVKPISTDNIRSIIAALRSNDPLPHGSIEITAERANHDSTLQRLDIDIAEAAATGAFLVQKTVANTWNSRYSYVSRQVVSLSDIAVTFVPSYDCRVIAWATNTHTGAPVQGAKISVYTSHYGASASAVNLDTSATTDADGIAMLHTTCGGDTWYERDALIEHDHGKVMYIGSVPAGNARFNAAALRISIKTDRVVYRIGEKIYVKGFVRAAHSTGDVPSQLVVSIRWSDQHTTARTLAVSNLGTFADTFEVPSNADYGHTFLHVQSNGNFYGVMSDGIIISDPRPPTVVMDESTLSDVCLPLLPTRCAKTLCDPLTKTLSFALCLCLCLAMRKGL